jgi:RNA polymerase sigma-70 factor (ECF subfamily)
LLKFVSITVFPVIVRTYFGRRRSQVTSRKAEDCLTSEAETAAEKDWGELLARAQRGDSAAYRLFLVSVIPFIRVLVRKRFWGPDGGEDVLQDVLLTVHRVRHTYEPGRPVKPWLAAITTRRAIDAARKRGRIAAKEVDDGRAYETFADPQANKEEAGEASQELKEMTSALSPAQQEALELVKLKEMSLVEASAVSGQSVASLKVNIHRAMKKLRVNLSKRPPE